ncbi:MAG: hypothetical protein ACP5RP_00995 [Candidatus Micrarchaeia archaeon]
MNFSKIGGMLFIIAGVIIFCMDLWLSYGIYKGCENIIQGVQGSTYYNQNSIANLSQSQSAYIGLAFKFIESMLPIRTYGAYLVMLIVLALFASIGYKLSKIGIELLKLEGVNKNGRGAQKR